MFNFHIRIVHNGFKCYLVILLTSIDKLICKFKNLEQYDYTGLMFGVSFP